MIIQNIVFVLLRAPRVRKTRIRRIDGGGRVIMDDGTDCVDVFSIRVFLDAHIGPPNRRSRACIVDIFVFCTKKKKTTISPRAYASSVSHCQRTILSRYRRYPLTSTFIELRFYIFSIYDFYLKIRVRLQDEKRKTNYLKREITISQRN